MFFYLNLTTINNVSCFKNNINPEINISEIIFSILQQQEMDINVTFNRAVKELSLSSNLFTKDIQNKFIDILYKVAEAFPPVEQAEKAVIDKFKAFLKTLNK